MSKLLNIDQIDQYKKDGAVLIKGKFDTEWIEKLKEGIFEDIKDPSPRFVRHTKEDDSPGYYEDFWTWNHFDEFEDFDEF